MRCAFSTVQQTTIWVSHSNILCIVHLRITQVKQQTITSAPRRNALCSFLSRFRRTGLLHQHWGAKPTRSKYCTVELKESNAKTKKLIVTREHCLMQNTNRWETTATIINRTGANVHVYIMSSNPPKLSSNVFSAQAICFLPSAALTARKMSI